MRQADRVLFILKKRGDYGDAVQSDTGSWGNRSHTGLHHSVRYVVEMLRYQGIEAHFVEVQDNNDIDREVSCFRPSHVVIEALWVVPEKFKVLVELHPAIQWWIRLHSELPFMAQEGIATDWIFEYLKHKHVAIAANSLRLVASLEHLTKREVVYTPNYYPLEPLIARRIPWAIDHLNVGCFGAIRPLKNQFLQAVAAIEFADAHRMHMRFHINADRVEQGGLPILHNLRALFKHSHHDLIEHGWLDAAEFHYLVRQMDMGLQASLSETFNIVSADFAVANVPLVVSPEVRWAASEFQADPNSDFDVAQKMAVAWAGRLTDLQWLNYRGLAKYDQESQVAWLKALAQ